MKPCEIRTFTGDSMSTLWKTNSLALAAKLVTQIDKEAELSLDAIDVRANRHGIEMRVLDRALELLHKNKHIERKTKKGTVYYSIKVIKKVGPGSHLIWLRTNYPIMTDSNNGSGLDMDFSHLFLSPEDLDKYKAQVAGRAYIPKKRYAMQKS